MNEQVPYTRRNLELRAAEYYASIRKQESEWKSIVDVESTLLEFVHRMQARDYRGAHQVLTLVDRNHLSRWGHYTRLIQINYTLAFAFVGQAVCTPYWINLTRRVTLLAPALTQYHRALDITSAPGVVRDALRDLELIRAVGIERPGAGVCSVGTGTQRYPYCY
jgi:hypothetical protein